MQSLHASELVPPGFADWYKLDEVIDCIQVIAPKISSEPLAAARHTPEASALQVQCFSNAQSKAQHAGGCGTVRCSKCVPGTFIPTRSTVRSS
jgi:hypothetical protein